MLVGKLFLNWWNLFFLNLHVGNSAQLICTIHNWFWWLICALYSESPSVKSCFFRTAHKAKHLGRNCSRIESTAERLLVFLPDPSNFVFLPWNWVGKAAERTENKVTCKGKICAGSLCLIRTVKGGKFVQGMATEIRWKIFFNLLKIS